MIADPLSEAFVTYMTENHLRSDNTIKRYRQVLGNIGNAGTATLEEVEAWWATRKDMAPATRENDLACLRAFYRWCQRWDHRHDDPTRRLESPQVPNSIPDPFSRLELETVLDFATKEKAWDMRRAIALGVYGTCRIHEAAAADWDQVNLEHRRLFIRGKGAKERLVGVGPLLLDEIMPNTGGNIVTAGGTPYSAAVLQRKINRFIERAGVTDKTFHDLRKRYATLALAKTGNAHAVAKVMGWASIETANTYAALSDEALDVIARAVE